MNFNKRTADILLLLTCLGAFWALYSGNLEAILGWMFSFVVLLNISDSDHVLSWIYFDENERTVTLIFHNEAEVTDFVRCHREFIQKQDLKPKGLMQATYTEKHTLSMSNNTLDTKSEEIQ